jgi:WD40 repeat protein
MLKRILAPVLCLAFLIVSCSPSAPSGQSTQAVTKASATSGPSDDESASLDLEKTEVQATMDFLFSPSTWAGSVPEGAMARLGKGVIRDIAAAPDGKSVAVASDAGIALYDASTFEEIWLYPSSMAAGKLAFSPKGDVLAVGFEGYWYLQKGEIHLLNVGDGTLLSSIQVSPTSLKDLAFSPAGDMIYYATSYSVATWDVETGAEEEITIEVPDEDPEKPPKRCESWSVAVSPDGKVLAAGCWDGTIALFDLEAGTPIQFLKGHEQIVGRLSFSPDGALLASASYDSSVRMWEAESGTMLWAKKNFVSLYEFDMSMSPDGKSLAITTENWNIDLLDSSSGRTIREMNRVGSYPYNVVEFSPAGKDLYAASQEMFMAFDPETGISYGQIYGYSREVEDIAVSPDGKTLSVASQDLTIWDMDTLAPLVLPGNLTFVASDILSKDYPSPEIFAGALVYSSDGKTLVVASMFSDGIALMDASTYETIRVLEPERAASTLELSADGKILAAGFKDGAIILWNTADWSTLMTLENDSNYVVELALSPDGKILVSPEILGSLLFWSVPGGGPLETLPEDINTYFQSFVFSPDGKYLALFDVNSAVTIWDVASWKRTLKLTLPDCHPIQLETYGPLMRYLSDERIVVGCGNGNLAVLDTQSGSYAVHRGHGRTVTSVVIAPDGKTVITGSRDGTVLIWKSLDDWITQ